jgi:hypothetical protein
MRDRRDAQYEPDGERSRKLVVEHRCPSSQCSRAFRSSPSRWPRSLPRPAAAEALAPRARGDAPVADAPAKEGSAPSSTAEPGTRGPESLAIAGAALGGAAEAGDAGGAGGAAEACGAGAPSSQASLAPDLAARPPRRFPLPQGHLVPAIETGLITGMMLAWNASIGAAPWAQIDEDTIGRNLRSNWVLDDDAFWVNQVGHPYQGIFPYSAARSAGLGFWWSTAYPFVASGVWEYVGETTPPSVNDQITTAVAGVVLGEALHRISGMILDGPRSPGRVVAATLVAPMEAVNRALVGTEPAGPTAPFRAALSVGALTFDPDRGTPGRERVVPEIGARVSYGLPGDRRFRFERPFDRFELEATYSTEKDPIGTVFARGRGGAHVRGRAGARPRRPRAAVRLRRAPPLGSRRARSASPPRVDGRRRRASRSRALRPPRRCSSARRVT